MFPSGRGHRFSFRDFRNRNGQINPVPRELNSEHSRPRLVLGIQVSQRELAAIMMMIDDPGILPRAADGEQVSRGGQESGWDRDDEGVNAHAQPLVNGRIRVPDVRVQNAGPFHILQVECQVSSGNHLPDLVDQPDGDRLVATEIRAQAVVRMQDLAERNWPDLVGSAWNWACAALRSNPDFM